MENKKVLLDVKNLSKYFNVKGQDLKAVDDVSFKINEGNIWPSRRVWLWQDNLW